MEQLGTSSCLYNHDGFNALTETEKQKLFTGAPVSAVGDREISRARRLAHQTLSLHSPTKHLKSLLLFNCVMDRTSLDWAHLFKNGLSSVIKLQCFDSVVLVS